MKIEKHGTIVPWEKRLQGKLLPDFRKLMES